MNRSVKNKPRSVAARLSRIATESGITYEQILLRYGQERLLWRMVHSSGFEGFVLKGAALFLAWQGRSYRTTRDVDFLGSGSSDMDRIKRMFIKLCDLDTYGNRRIGF
jgi:hypothetical protein